MLTAVLTSSEKGTGLIWGEFTDGPLGPVLGVGEPDRGTPLGTELLWVQRNCRIFQVKAIAKLSMSTLSSVKILIKEHTFMLIALG